MTIKEFMSWCAFNKICPIGDERNDYHAAQITNMIYSVNAGKNSKKTTIDDHRLFKTPTLQDLQKRNLTDVELALFEAFNK